jgi:hypothetical protein
MQMSTSNLLARIDQKNVNSSETHFLEVVLVGCEG